MMRASEKYFVAVDKEWKNRQCSLLELIPGADTVTVNYLFRVFIYGLCNDAVSISHHVASNGRMTDE